MLADLIGTVARAATTRTGALPVLSGIHLTLAGDTLTATGTDLELSIRVTETVNGETDGAGVVPARLTGDIVRGFDTGAVTFEMSGTEAHLSAGRSRFSVRTLSADDYPRLPEPSGNAVTVPAALLISALKQVVRAASFDDARPILTGVLMAAEADGLRLVATDSYRLAVRDLDIEVVGGDRKVLVPSRALAELNRLLSAGTDAIVRLGERDVTFETGTVRLATRLLEGEYPNYRQLIPVNQPNRVTVNRAALLDAIKRVKLLARDTTPLRLSMSADRLDLTAITQDVGQATESLDAEYDGTDLTVAFNAEYLSAGIDAATGDQVVIELLDALKPALVKNVTADGFLYLLMPVRVP